MSKSLNIRLNDELGERLEKVMSNDKNKDKTITQFVKDAVCNYIKEQEELEKGLYTIKLPISQFSIDELDSMSTSFAYVHQALLNRYSTAGYVGELDLDIKFDENIENSIVDINKLLMHIAKLKKQQLVEFKKNQD